MASPDKAEASTGPFRSPALQGCFLHWRNGADEDHPQQLLTLSLGYRTLEMFSARFRSRTASM